MKGFLIGVEMAFPQISAILHLVNQIHSRFGVEDVMIPYCEWIFDMLTISHGERMNFGTFQLLFETQTQSQCLGWKHYLFS